MKTQSSSLPEGAEAYLEEVREAHGLNIAERCREHFIGNPDSWADPDRVLQDALQEDFDSRAEELDAQMRDPCTS